MERKAELKRETLETEVYIDLNLDGRGKGEIDTGIGFLDHMLTLFKVHGGFDLTVKAKGDLNVDFHHTVEDVGIVLGQVFLKAIGDKEGINRYGSIFLPMDESLAMAAVDISGRPYYKGNLKFTSPKIGNFDSELVEEFLRAFTFNSMITLHLDIVYGVNNHHMAEAAFKALAHSLKMALKRDELIKGVLSSKGVL